MKNFIFFTVISLGLLAFKCDGVMEKFYPILFINDSARNIKVHFVKPGGGNLYPDTTLVDEKPIVINIPSNEDNPAYLKVKYEQFFKALLSDTLSIFIIDSEIYENIDWVIIRDEYKILKRYDLSLGDLERLDFKVVYPPNTSMEGVKMYPF